MPATAPTAGPAGPAYTLQRITTGYDLHHDRLRLAGACADGSTHTLWLTQRLLIRLLPPLWRWLEQHDTPASDTTSTGTTAPLPEPRQQAMQDFCQQAACAQLAPQTPVTPGGDSPQWLVYSVQISTHPTGVELQWQCTTLHNPATTHSAAPPPPGTSLHLSFTALTLRQWLAMVLQQYRQGEWATQHWPAWLSHSARADVLH